jgi:hypothetical protein
MALLGHGDSAHQIFAFRAKSVANGVGSDARYRLSFAGSIAKANDDANGVSLITSNEAIAVRVVDRAESILQRRLHRACGVSNNDIRRFHRSRGSSASRACGTGPHHHVNAGYQGIGGASGDFNGCSDTAFVTGTSASSNRDFYGDR